MQNYIVFTTNPNLKQYKSCLKRYKCRKLFRTFNDRNDTRMQKKCKFAAVM